MKSFGVVLAAILMLGLFGGCAANKPQPVHRPITTSSKPIIDFGHGAAGFPLVGKEPIDSSHHLANELTAGYAARVSMPTSRPTVTIDGELPAIKKLTIDLSGGDVKSAYRPSSLRGVDKVTQVGHVEKLQYIAEPLTFAGATQRLNITAYDVTLALLHARGEREVLVMSDVGSGAAHFEAGLSDLNKLLNAAAVDRAGSVGFFVTDTKLTLTSDGPHSLEGTMFVQGFFVVVPTSLTIHGRVDIDNNFQATISHLTCTGGDVGGPIAAKFINDRLAKYEGRQQPLAAFPGDHMKLRAVKIKVDDALRVDSEFGR